MPPKKQLPQPIDRPLSRAYLRQFKGWSTAYPPGISDPSTMRLMENLQVNRNGTVRIRPAVKNLLRMAAPYPEPEELPGTNGDPWIPGESEIEYPYLEDPLDPDWKIVGSHESFYLNDGTKALLFAVRGMFGFDRVVFKVAASHPDGTLVVLDLDDWRVDFDLTDWPGGIGSPDGEEGNEYPFFTNKTTYVRYLQIDNKILALSNAGESLITFHVGETKKVPWTRKINYPLWKDLPSGDSSAPLMGMPQYDWYVSDKTGYPAFATEFGGANTLISSVPSENVYNYAVFYTYSNDLGESEPSIIGQVRLRRPWGGWLMEESGVPVHGYGSTFPSGNVTSVPELATDLLSIVLPGNYTDGFDDAVEAGATKLNFYLMSWSIQDSVPVEMQLIGSRDLDHDSTAASHGWFVMNPTHLGMGSSLPVPTVDNRYNSSEPPRAAQGIVAADRLVLVNDPTAAAVIRWTTNEQGNYLNFAPHRGGGYKTLTSGNMQIPGCVKLWQNPQSADTLTILNRGTDSYSTAYYMAPATVTSQSDNTNVMGFEETTATPGTVSQYGCEVANNALYHPLDEQLMKSTASNYNINHKSMTDVIADSWQALQNKDNIVSCFFDQRLYFLVHNPAGAELEAGCMGNEVWVLDLGSENGTWSRFLLQGCSLRKLEVDGLVQLSLVRPDGIFVLDDASAVDERIVDGVVTPFNIAWKLETNTQGANRAHDAWAHVRQVSIVVGNFTGRMRYGIRGKDQHGQVVNLAKIYEQEVLTGGDDFDAEDMLRIARELKEWFFYASSVETEGETDPSYGQLSLVQYRYTPVSVNVGWDFGSVETFEYGRDVAGAASLSDNGIPQPYLDTARP